MSTPDDLIAACRALYAAIDRLDHAAASRAGVSRNDLRALTLLEGGPASPGAIGAHLGLTSGAVTALIDRLETRGLVRRTPDPADRRGVVVEATADLFACLGPLYAGVARRLSETAQRYSAADLDAAVRHLTDATAAYTAAFDAPPE